MSITIQPSDLTTCARHCSIFQAPYWSCDDTIEHIFNSNNSCLLHFWDHTENMINQENAVGSIIKMIMVKNQNICLKNHYPNEKLEEMTFLLQIDILLLQFYHTVEGILSQFS